jgi:small subunit ribosomal protein S5
MSTKQFDKTKNPSGIRHNKKGKIKIREAWNERVVEVQRVSKVVKGGKKFSFRVTVIVGKETSQGQVGVGVGKADEVSRAIKKAVNDAKKNVILIPLTKTNTIPHMVMGINGASKVLIRPAISGTGVIAGSSIKIVLELAGIQNILAKQLGSNNLLNNARATILGLKLLKTSKDVANERDLALERIYSYSKKFTY